MNKYLNKKTMATGATIVATAFYMATAQTDTTDAETIDNDKPVQEESLIRKISNTRNVKLVVPGSEYFSKAPRYIGTLNGTLIKAIRDGKLNYQDGNGPDTRSNVAFINDAYSNSKPTWTRFDAKINAGDTVLIGYVENGVPKNISYINQTLPETPEDALEDAALNDVISTPPAENPDLNPGVQQAGSDDLEVEDLGDIHVDEIAPVAKPAVESNCSDIGSLVIYWNDGTKTVGANIENQYLTKFAGGHKAKARVGDDGKTRVYGTAASGGRSKFPGSGPINELVMAMSRVPNAEKAKMNLPENVIYSRIASKDVSHVDVIHGCLDE